jgi:hypothetical protein
MMSDWYLKFQINFNKYVLKEAENIEHFLQDGILLFEN